MSNYYDMREAKVNIANELRNRGWEILDYKEDESDAMTDYYSPANWGGIAKKNGFILCVDTPYSAKSMPIEKYNYGSCLSQTDLNKIEKLKALTQERGATEGEESNAKLLIEKIKNNKSNAPEVEIIGYTTAHMANPGRCKWHIEKDGSIYDKGTGITKYRDLPDSWKFDINTMQFKESYNKWNGKKRELPEETKKIINDFKKLILRWERIVNCMNGMGDGTEETEKGAQEQQQNEKMEKVIKKVTKKVWKMIEIKRDSFKVGDYITLAYHGHYWKITEECMKTGTWKGVKDTRKAFIYEIVGSASRGYKDLKNPKGYYDFEYRMVKSLEEGKIKIFELKEVEEVQEVEKWIRVKTQKKNTYKKENTNTITEKETQQQNSKEESIKDVKQEEKQINVSVKFNEEKNGIELHFTGKPSQEIREQIKSNGFKWSKFQKIWYAKNSEERKEFLKSIGFIKSENNNSEPITVSSVEENLKEIEYPTIDIDDIDSYKVSEELSKRENSISMFRSKDTNHTEELQKTLQSANDNVIELIKMEGCTPYIEYKAKTILQSFKKNYTNAYISVLEHRANNPSWAVTGRGGLNVRRYNKKQEHLTNKMKYQSELIHKFDSKIEQFENKIINNQNQKLKIELENNLNSIEQIPKFKRVKVEINGDAMANDNVFDLNNASYTLEKTGHQLEKYTIIKNYGCFVVYNSKGLEVWHTKTNENLDVAKKYVLYLLSQEQEKKAI
ncbi:hypothetical protein FCV38_11935 [Clostridium sporogenes]|nr:hypothetical protein [Clostridium sporogenes]